MAYEGEKQSLLVIEQEMTICGELAMNLLAVVNSSEWRSKMKEIAENDDLCGFANLPDPDAMVLLGAG